MWGPESDWGEVGKGPGDLGKPSLEGGSIEGKPEDVGRLVPEREAEAVLVAQQVVLLSWV